MTSANLKPVVGVLGNRVMVATSDGHEDLKLYVDDTGQLVALTDEQAQTYYASHLAATSKPNPRLEPGPGGPTGLPPKPASQASQPPYPYQQPELTGLEYQQTS